MSVIPSDVNQKEKPFLEDVNSQPRPYSAGTLTYTKMGLLFLFASLLWGDFCLTLMQEMFASLLPLKLKMYNASNVTMGLIITTIPGALNFFVNPIISFKSDRYRSHWGRRRPFLFFAAPFVGLFLVAIGFSDQISTVFHKLIPGMSSLSLGLVIVAILVICYQFFYMFVISTYYYYFNDVVPKEFLARFMSLFRITSTAASALYNAFILKYAEGYLDYIFAGSGLLFAIAFIVMCITVKEGTYPPPAENIDKRKGVISSVKTYCTECFTNKFYWYFFLSNAFWQLSTCAGMFLIFFYLSLGLNLDQVGKVNAVSGIVGIVLLYPAGMLADKFHPVRIMLFIKIGFLLFVPLYLIFFFVDFPPAVAFWVVVVITACSLPFRILYLAANMPVYMKLLPKEKYGQFSSADAMLRAFFMIVGSVLAGFYVDFVKQFHSDEEYCYRYIHIWTLFFELFSIFFYILLYRKWKHLGGVENYVPPSTLTEKENDNVFQNDKSEYAKN
jgi:MFS family permease